MTAHLDGRLNSLGSAPEDVETRLSAIASAFGLDWLQNGGDHPLQGLWRRRDALATCQLAWFGDAICGMRQIDEKWTRRELAKIRNEPANNRKGAAFELLGLNIFAQRKKCQSAFKFDPGSASNFDPFDRAGLAVALVSSEPAGVAETRRARVA